MPQIWPDLQSAFCQWSMLNDRSVTCQSVHIRKHRQYPNTQSYNKTAPPKQELGLKQMLLGYRLQLYDSLEERVFRWMISRAIAAKFKKVARSRTGQEPSTFHIMKSRRGREPWMGLTSIFVSPSRAHTPTHTNIWYCCSCRQTDILQIYRWCCSALYRNK